MKIEHSKKQRVWFTSDTHYSHTNICRGVSKWSDTSRTRLFKNLEEMNAAIVKGINDNVEKDDVLIHFGDWSFGDFSNIIEFRSKIKCNNIILLLGNHDDHIRNNKNGIQSFFTKVSHYEYFTILKNNDGEHEKIRIVGCHFPIASWHDLNRGTIHLHGHVHLPPEYRFSGGKMMDVGIDGHPEFRPYHLDEILDFMKRRPIKSLIKIDHHA